MAGFSFNFKTPSKVQITITLFLHHCFVYMQVTFYVKKNGKYGFNDFQFIKFQPRLLPSSLSVNRHNDKYTLLFRNNRLKDIIYNLLSL